ncbi:MAG: hypothetical protein DA330_09070 [Nitrososphaera sp.]|nr:hypothetical protein [Nitrososphaera sp.]
MIEYKKARDVDDLVCVERREQIMIGHKETPDNGVLCLKLTDFDAMSEQQILDKYNAHIDWLLDGILNDRPIEIAPGHAQLKWSKTSKQWTLAGDVLRCEVDWDSGEDELGGQVAIKIEDTLLSGEEFLKMIETYEGWGMRIEFMHPNRLTNPPEPIVQIKGR